MPRAHSHKKLFKGALEALERRLGVLRIGVRPQRVSLTSDASNSKLNCEEFGMEAALIHAEVKSVVFNVNSGEIKASLIHPCDASEKLAVVLPGAGYSCTTSALNKLRLDRDR
ncbi:MAG: hypothetical protein AB7G93_10750 [Bdellovibrionales bacterium]